MKKGVFAFLMVAALSLSVLQYGNVFVTAFAASDEIDINDLLKNQNTTQEATTSAPEVSTTVTQTQEGIAKDDSSAFIDSIVDNLDYTQPESPEVKAFGDKVQKVTSWIVQGLVYIFTALLVISKLLDLAYVAIPFTRTALANGYIGNGAAAGTQANGMMGGGMMGSPMGGGMMGGGFGGYGMNRGFGMNRGMGMGMGVGGSMMGADAGMAAQNQPAHGRMQFVSNAALNAVATESVIGPDGKGQSAFKTYAKDMVISLVAAPMLIVLCATGSIAQIGFGIGKFVSNVLIGIKF